MQVWQVTARPGSFRLMPCSPWTLDTSYMHETIIELARWRLCTMWCTLECFMLCMHTVTCWYEFLGSAGSRVESSLYMVVRGMMLLSYCGLA